MDGRMSPVHDRRLLSTIDSRAWWLASLQPPDDDTNDRQIDGAT